MLNLLVFWFVKHLIQNPYERCILRDKFSKDDLIRLVDFY